LDDPECIILPDVLLVKQHMNPPLKITKKHCHLRPTLVTDYLLPTPLSTPFYNSRCRQSTAPPPPVIYVTFLVADLIIFNVHRHDLQVFITFQQHHLDGVVASGSRYRGHTDLGGRKLKARGMPLYRRTLQCDTDLNGSQARPCQAMHSGRALSSTTTS